MASSLSVPLLAVPNFTGENYDFWNIKMKLFLKSCDLWDTIEPSFKLREEGIKYSAEQLQQLKTNEMKDAKALLYIHNAVSDNITPKIIRASSAKEAWNILLEEFRGSKKVRLIKLNKLRRDYTNIKMRDDENIKEYSSRFMELVNELHIYGETTSNESIVAKVLITLNSKFMNNASIMEEFKELKKLGISELFSTLLAHEEKFNKSEESTKNGVLKSKYKSKLFSDENAIGPKGMRSLFEIYQKCPIVHLDYDQLM